MSIGKKLYYGFSGVIALAFILGLVNFGALMRTRKATQNTARSIQVLDALAQGKLQMSANRLTLSNYLLSGSPDDARKMEDGVAALQAKLQAAAVLAPDQRSSLKRAAQAEQDWHTNFADAVVSKRKDVDAGNATVSDLEIYYLNLDPSGWIRKSTAPLEEAEKSTQDALKAQSDSDDRASNLMLTLAIAFALMAIGGGAAIAYFTAKSITTPLGQLIAVAREIAETGDLNQHIDIERSDEIGVLAGTFAKMVA